MSTTATVETLTASVHVLMVGHRQITLSVARQLDRVRYSELEPMGRVRLSSDRDLGCDIIGRDPDSGALVIAGSPPYAWGHELMLADDDLQGRTVGPAFTEELPLRLAECAWGVVLQRWHTMVPRGAVNGAGVPMTDDDWRQLIRHRQLQHEEAAALPLVLAGLR